MSTDSDLAVKLFKQSDYTSKTQKIKNENQYPAV